MQRTVAKLSAASTSAGVFAVLCYRGYMIQGESLVARDTISATGFALAGVIVGALAGLGATTRNLRPALLVALCAALLPVAIVPLYVCDGSVYVVPLYAALSGYLIAQITMYVIGRVPAS